MSARMAILVILSFMATTQAVIPPGHIMDISPACGSNGIGDALVTILTDLELGAKAICAGDKVDFVSSNGVEFTLPVSYPVAGGGSSPCKFVKKKGALVFTIQVDVGYGRRGSRLHQNDELYTISCSFQPGTSKKSGSLSVKPGFNPPKVIAGNKPPVSKSAIRLYIVDVIGRKLGASAPAGKMVRLKAVTLGLRDKGLRADSCDALNPKGGRYPVLRSGCGNGMVLKKTKGFITIGKKTYSHFFKLFTVNGDPSISFVCNFTVCDTKCNGPSCFAKTPGRRRRDQPGDSTGTFLLDSMGHVANAVTLTSDPVNVHATMAPSKLLEARRSRVGHDQ
ncbi:vitelline envelope sperm lysin receptor-like [Haliotis asinina]|uniref:vitelline envelope sperm lysin receptor-like n=1 Tax=Haliotis asinina TaxID=109174 RepID=UPI00353255E8